MFADQNADLHKSSNINLLYLCKLALKSAEICEK